MKFVTLKCKFKPCHFRENITNFATQQLVTLILCNIISLAIKPKEKFWPRNQPTQFKTLIINATLKVKT